MSSTQQLLLGEGAGGGPPVFIEDVFSTYLYTGTGAALTITNNIDLSTKGGLVWIKGRSGATNHALYDTARGATKDLVSNSSAAETTQATGLTAFSGTGFSLGALAKLNTSAATYVSWTFRKQPKFFDIVTFTTNGSKPPNTGNIAHNLGSTPGCVMVKSTSGAQDWKVYHIGLEYGGGLAINRLLQLNDTGTIQNSTNWINVSSTTISFPGSALDSGVDFVAYLFADDAGGFGLAGTDNVISCGSFSGSYGAFTTVNLGYEPQWIMWKAIDGGGGNWNILDTMRQWVNDGDAGKDATLFPNTSGAENTAEALGEPNATGFRIKMQNNDGGSGNYIYIAIRRGPMKVPTSGTSVFLPTTYTGSSGNQSITGVGFPPDLFMANWRANTKGNFEDRLRGTAPYLQSTETGAEASNASNIVSYDMSGITLGVNNLNNKDGASFVGYFYQRAPSFFDEVCYTGTGSATTFSHNLQAVPELMIVKSRSDADFWRAYSSATGNTKILIPNTDDASLTSTSTWNSTTPTSSVFTLGTDGQANGSGKTFVNYLFSTCPGVSKVGSYTGTGTTLQINCGFTAGSRFVLIKRTDSTGDWYVWDSARGIISGNDPYFLLNTTAAEVTGTDYVDTYSAGFEISSTAPAAINANGGTFIFLAIA